MNAPDTFNTNWEEDDYRKAKDMVDLGMSIVGESSSRVKEIFDTYKSYHGNYTSEEKRREADVRGKVSATEFQTYHFSKVKIDQLLNESLQVGFSQQPVS